MPESARETGKRRRNGFSYAALVALVVALGSASVSHRLDTAILDSQLRADHASPSALDPGDLIIVGIDDQTLELFAEPLALWHAHLGDFLAGMARVQPRVLGLDIVLPERSYDEILPGQDRHLLAGLLALKRAKVPLALAQTIDVRGRTRPIFPAIVSVAGDESLGLALVAPDDDGTVRRIEGDIASGRGEFSTFFGRLTAAVGVERSSGLIDYGLGPAFRYVPLHDVVSRIRSGRYEDLQAQFADKIVLVGTVQPFVDRLAVPVDLLASEPENYRVPGVVVQAQALRSVTGPGLIQPVGEGVRWALLLLATSIWFAARRLVVGGLASVAGLAVLWLLSTRFLEIQTFLPVGGAMLAVGLAFAGRSVLEAVDTYLEKRRLRQSFGAYVSPGVMDGILSGDIQPVMSGERRRVCMLFSDIRDFTTISEHQTPEFVIKLLNQYFEEMTTSVHQHGGTVDKFIGDGLMGFFGAPNSLSQDVVEAGFACAADMLERLGRLNERFAAEGIEPIAIGIGLHVGEAVVGHLGSKARHEYTAIGDTVNTAARLEGLTKSLGYPVLCSKEVAAVLASSQSLAELGPQALKGRAPIVVFGWAPGGVK